MDSSARLRSQRPVLDDFVLPPAIPKRLDSDFAMAVKSPALPTNGYSRQALLRPQQQDNLRERPVQPNLQAAPRVPAGNQLTFHAHTSSVSNTRAGPSQPPHKISNRLGAAAVLPVRQAPQPLQQTTVLAQQNVFDTDGELLASMTMEQSPLASSDSIVMSSYVAQTTTVGAPPAPPAAAVASVASVDVHEPCKIKVLELEHLLAEERAARASDRVSTAIKQEEGVQSAIQAATSEAVSKLELRLAELQHQLEAEKLRNVELDTALMEAVSSHEREKSAWVLDKQSVLAEAEMGYAGLARSVTDRAQSTIAALRAELKSMDEALEQERNRADAAAAALRAAEHKGRDEARQAATIAELKTALEQERSNGAAMQDALQRQIQNLIKEAASSRAKLFEEVEAETSAILEQARMDGATARAQLETERNLHAASQQRLKKEYEAQCMAFESRLRAKVSRTISLLRQASMPPGSQDLPSLLSPLVGALPGVMQQQATALDDLQDNTTLPTDNVAADIPAQPDFDQPVEVPTSASRQHQQAKEQTGSPHLLSTDLLVQATRPSPQLTILGTADAPFHAPMLAAAPQLPADERPLSFNERADSLLAAADDVLAAVLAAMTPEQRELWQNIERRMKQDEEARF